MEKVILELIAALIVLLLTVAGTIKLSNRQTERSMQSEREARSALEKQLRQELAEATGNEQTLRQRVVGLEENRQRDQAKLEEADHNICDLRGQLTTILNEMASLQRRILELEGNLQKEQAENGRLRSENDDLRRQLSETRTILQVKEIEVRTYQSALALVGAKFEPGEKSTSPLPESSVEVSEENKA